MHIVEWKSIIRFDPFFWVDLYLVRNWGATRKHDFTNTLGTWVGWYFSDMWNQIYEVHLKTAPDGQPYMLVRFDDGADEPIEVMVETKWWEEFH